MIETFDFSSDINQLLSLIINSFYNDKDIFLRELISNASDALNKIDRDNLEIKIIPNYYNRTLTIQDNGIGMTKDDLINKLGKIAASNTKEFIDNTNNTSFIGQFGVGFYSSFLVANKIKVITKNDNDEQYIWESCGGSTFNICKDNNNVSRGTSIILFLKDDMLEYLDQMRLETIIDKYCEFIDFPIKILEKKEIDGTFVDNWKLLNENKAIWLREPDTITKQEYIDFFKGTTNEWQEFITMDHFKVTIDNNDFTCLLFIPQKPQFNMFQDTETVNRIKLYVRKVFILNNSIDLLPDYLKFIIGVIDSNDLKLNVSRGSLQNNNILLKLKDILVNRVIDMMYKIEDYNVFYEKYRNNIKLGIYDDLKNRQKLLGLLRYKTNINDNYSSLDDCISYNNENIIYYINGENIEFIKNSPFIDIYNNYSIMVLFMIDPMDDYYLQNITEYNNNEFIDITRYHGGDKVTKLCKKIKKVLGNDVDAVIVSNRLDTHPCAISTHESGPTAYMEKVLKAESMRYDDQYVKPVKILEINKKDEIIKKLKKTKGCKFDNIVFLLYDTALISSGFDLNYPKRLGNNINDVIFKGLSIKDDSTNVI